MFLPLSLLWVVVACVVLCERESSHTAKQVISADVSTIEGVPDCDECPLNFFPQAISPEQTKPVISLVAALANSTLAVLTCSNPDCLDHRQYRVLCTVSPPLERLSSLRI